MGIHIDIGPYISALISYMGQAVAFMRSVTFTYGGLSISLFDIEVSLLVLTFVLMIALPHFDD